MQPNAFSNLQAITIRLRPGEDLKLSLDEYVKMKKIPAACIITCAGSLQQAAIRYANKQAADLIIEKFEIVSLTGTLSQNGSHLHIAVSDGTGKTIAGHLKEGSVVYTTAEIVIGILQDEVYNRETDNTYGYKELVIKHNQ